MTESANPQLEMVEGLFKSLIWDTLVKVGTVELFVAVPFLAIWPLNMIVSSFINMLGNAFFKQFKMVIDLQAIAFVNEQHRKEFDKATVVLKVIAHDKGADSDEFRKAKDEAAQSLSKFVHFGS